MCSAITLAVSRRQLLKSVLMMESAEDRPRHAPHVPWEMMVDDEGRGQSRRCLRHARTETA